jgi:hypothetical protein
MTCITCRYWSSFSERPTQGANAPRGKNEALCLNVSSLNVHKYTVEGDNCEVYKRAGG